MNVVLLLAMLITPQQTQVVDFASPIQAEAFRYGPSPMCLSGGWGAGKTWLGCMKGLWLSDTFPKNRGVIARRVAKELRATTMTTFYKLCPPSAYDPRLGGRRNDQDGLCRLNNGSEILFLHLDDPATETIIAGLEVNWFLIDQAEENPEQMEEIFDKLSGRLGRWDVATVPDWMVQQYAPWPWCHPVTGRPMPPTYAMLACNPDVELHWIYRRFHPDALEHQQRYKPLGYKLFHMPGRDNKYLPDWYKAEMEAKDATFKRRYWEGTWGIPEGAIHQVDKASLIQGDYELLDWLRRTCRLYRFLDHGDTSPTCCLWMAVDRDGNLFWYREYYQPNALVSTHRQNIAALSEGESYEWNQADPSIFAKIKSKISDTQVSARWSVADEYADVLQQPKHTAIFWQPADNNELGTRNRINEYLHVDPGRIHPITKARGAPKMYFVQASDNYPQGCQHVIREIRAQRRVKLGTDLGKPVFTDERDPNIPDHAYDPLRYGVASHAPKAGGTGFELPGTWNAEHGRLLHTIERQVRRS